MDIVSTPDAFVQAIWPLAKEVISATFAEHQPGGTPYGWVKELSTPYGVTLTSVPLEPEKPLEAIKLLITTVVDGAPVIPDYLKSVNVQFEVVDAFKPYFNEERLVVSSHQLHRKATLILYVHRIKPTLRERLAEMALRMS